MKKLLHVISFLPLAASTGIQAQEIPTHPTEVVTGVYWGVSRPLRDLPPLTPAEYQALEKRSEDVQFNEGLEFRNYPFAATALPQGDDPVWQKNNGTRSGSRSPIVNFNGQNSPYFPPDCNGTAGPNHFMQTINCIYAIYDKTGTLVAGPTPINQLFGNVPGANNNDGDPIILYDEVADRWLVTEFSINGSPDYILMAVSTTNDPTGTWHQYSFVVATMPDYPKFGIWQDGYYMGDNNPSGNDIYVMERAKMLEGQTAQLVGFNNPWRPASSDGFMCVPPIDNDGDFAPAGSPGLYIAFNDDALGGGADQLWIYELNVDWTTPSSSTFQRVQQINVDPFNANFGSTWNNIPQPATSQKLDAIPQVVMNVPQYRNFGDYQTIVCCHTVKVNTAGLAGIRWYELRRTTSEWTVRQQGTYAPDNDCRWMGSVMLNGSNKIALGYSVSSTTVYPSIRYAGQSPTAYASASGTLDIPEDTIFTGANSQTTYNRWGDYSLMSVDPADDETFWFTTQYVGPGGGRKTRIASFQFQTGPLVATLDATDITDSSATLNGTVGPMGESTTYYFKFGTTPGVLNDSTPEQSAGSGTDTLDVNADLAGLASNQIYYFLLIAYNTNGISVGDTLTFTTDEAPMLSVFPDNQDVNPSPGVTEFYVTSNTDWTAESDMIWCTVTPAGTGNDTLFATYSENNTGDERIAAITVSGTNVSPQTVTVTQAPYPAGVDMFSDDVLRIYPNPNDGSFTLIHPYDRNDLLHITVQDPTGHGIYTKELQGSTSYLIRLPSPALGIFFLTVRSGSAAGIRKLVIDR